MMIEYEDSIEPCQVCGDGFAMVMLVTLNGGTTQRGPMCLSHLNQGRHCLIIDAPKYDPPKQAKIKKLSQKQERQVMADLGGRTQPASGAKPGHKGDGRLYGHLRMEAKFTLAESYSLKLAELAKLRSECEDMEAPVMVLDFKDRSTGREKDRWAIFPYAMLLELLKKAGVIQ